MWSRWLGRRATPSVPAPISIAPSQEFDGNDGPWSSFPIQIGTPPQTVKVLVSTASSQTWAVNPQGCLASDLGNCPTLRGGFFNPNVSSSWNQNQDVANGLAPLLLESSFLNETGNGLYGYDTIVLGSGGPTLDQQVVASIATKQFYTGLFGLNPQSSELPETTFQIPAYLSKLNQSNLIPSLSWSYTAGNQYRPGPVYGSLILGGYDDSRFVPNDVSFTFNTTDPRGLMVNIGEMFLTTNDFTTTLSTNNESLPAFIDSTSPYIILPLNVCEQFEETFGLSWNESVQAYLVNDTLHDTLTNQDTSVAFNIGNPSTVPGQGFNISLPYSAFNLTASAPLLNTAGRYFPLIRAANDSQITLGRTFLQEAYVIANYEHNNFSVSQCNWNTTAKSHIVPIKGIRSPDQAAPPPPPPPHKLSGGAIAGIVIGALAALTIAVLLALFIWRKRRPKQPQEPKETPIQPVEIDSAFKDHYGFMASPTSTSKDHPHSPELEGAEHKGHELDARSTYFEHTSSPTATNNTDNDNERYELDATERRSRNLSSPISFMSDGSNPPNPNRMHSRQPSDDPVSATTPTRQRSELHKREISDPVSVASPMSPMTPTRQRSEAQRLHKRELSDPVSLMSERREDEMETGTGTE